MTIVQRLHYKHTNMQIFGEIQTSAGDRKRSDLPALIWQRLVMNPECLTTLHQPLSVKRQSVTVPSVHNACGNGAAEGEGVRGYVESSAVPLTLRYVSDGC